MRGVLEKWGDRVSILSGDMRNSRQVREEDKGHLLIR